MICLSFDTDHVDEPRMREFVDTVPVPGAGTFFCTQRYEAVAAPHELCPHPYLPEGADWDSELAAKRADYPEARGWRAHSCVYSHLLAQRIASDGYVYASAFDQLGRVGIEPSREAWGVWHLPIYYMDSLDFSLGRFWPGAAHRRFDPALIEAVLTNEGIYVFDFHPVHLLLNSTSAEAYFERRDAFVAGAPLYRLRCTGYGTRNFYDDLCAAMRDAGVESSSMYDALRSRVGEAGLGERQPAQSWATGQAMQGFTDGIDRRAATVGVGSENPLSYVVLTDLYSHDEVVRAREEVFALFARRFADINGDDLREERLLGHYYDSERDRWRECARRMWDLLGVYSLAAGPAVSSVLRALGLGEPIISRRPEVRTDIPGDQQYMQPWHQDWPYGQGSANAVTIWTPLRDVGIENGTIDVMPRTHLLGNLDIEELSDPRRFSIVDPLIDDLPYEPVEMRLGEAIVFSQLLVHRSGFNRSGRARVTIQTSFGDSAEPEFVRNGFPTPQGSALVWDAPPSRADAEAVFAVAGESR